MNSWPLGVSPMMAEYARRVAPKPLVPDDVREQILTSNWGQVKLGKHLGISQYIVKKVRERYG